jgi:hypothetical protein
VCNLVVKRYCLLAKVVYVGDLKHMCTVRSESHSTFASENEMASFLMSAKNGDQVNKVFWKVASMLSGSPCTLLYLARSIIVNKLSPITRCILGKGRSG